MYDYNRYGDRLKFITDESKINICEECYVPISAEEDYDMAILKRRFTSALIIL